MNQTQVLQIESKIILLNFKKNKILQMDHCLGSYKCLSIAF